MPEPENRESFTQRLLEQDTYLSSPRYQVHRMELELQLSRAEWKEKLAGRVVLIALPVALVAMFLAGSRTFGSPDPSDDSANVLSVSIGVIHFVAAVTFWLGLASYFSRFRPAVRQARDRLLEESIRELRQEVQELRRQLAPSSPPPTP